MKQRSKNNGRRRWASAVLGGAACLTLAFPAAAQSLCPEAQAIAPWVPGDVGHLASGSAYPEAGGIQLCSASPGFGHHQDGYRYAVSLVGGDFTVSAKLTDVEVGGSAGLVATLVNRDGLDNARIVLLAERANDVPNAVRLRTGIRIDNGAAASWSTTQPVVALPVKLQLRREGTQIFAEYEHEAQMVPLHSEQVAGSPLLWDLSAGLVATSNNATKAKRASFVEASATLPPLPPEPQCGDAQPMLDSGGTFTVKGLFLDRTTSATVDGVPATILRKTPQTLLLQMPTVTRGPVVRSEVQLLTQSGSQHSVPGGAAIVGTPFKRGDANGDGEVTREDWKQICHAVFRSKPTACMAASDVNADGQVNENDVSQLKRYLQTGQMPPAEPFAQAGLVAGGFTCGLSEGPQLSSVSFGSGAPITQRVQEGDWLILRGQGLDAHQAQLFYDDVTLEVDVERSTAQALHARVGQVASAGKRCPIVMNAGVGDTRFGPAFTVNENAPLCLEFAPSPAFAGTMARADREGTIVLTLPRTQVARGQELLVDAAYFMPFVDGKMGGPRTTKFSFQFPTSGRDAYGTGLAQLAQTLSKKLNGKQSNACGCEVEVVPVPQAEKLILQPCLPPPPPPPQPVVPGLPTKVKPIKHLTGHLGVYNPLELPTCSDDINPAEQPRLFAWCHFADMLKTHQGLPYFESFTPLDYIEGLASGPQVFQTPPNRPVYQKGVLVEPAALASLHAGDYANPCGMALRSTQCAAGFEKDWMPAFKKDTRLVKAFWRTADYLPFSMNTNKLYSYVDPNGKRQYLVGMHVAVSKGWAGASESYFMWNTFWVPASKNDTITKNGSPLASSYSQHCKVGSGADRPDSLISNGAQHFIMCTDSAPGEAACGNPWVPSECPAEGETSCTGCHSSMGFANLSNPETSFAPRMLAAGWLPSFITRTAAKASACFAEIENNLSQFNDWLEPSNGIRPARCDHPEP